MCSVNGQAMPPCPGLTSVLIVNTGSFPIAYTAQPLWETGYPPGVPMADPNELTGVLGARGTHRHRFCLCWRNYRHARQQRAVLGSGQYENDEGVIPWPGGVASGGASQMFVAQIDVVGACEKLNGIW